MSLLYLIYLKNLNDHKLLNGSEWKQYLFYEYSPKHQIRFDGKYDHQKSSNQSALTFFTGLSISLQSLDLIFCNSLNLEVTSSMESCSRSQNPARSWEVGRGMALGSCNTNDDLKHYTLNICTFIITNIVQI